MYTVLPDNPSRTLGDGWKTNLTPQVQPMTTVIGSPQETRFTVMPDSWKSLWRAINGNDEKKFQMVTAYNTAVFNWPASPDGDGWPHGVESLCFGSGDAWENVIAARVVSADYIEILTLSPTDTVPMVSRQSHPWFVHRWTNVGHDKITKSTKWSDAVQGDCYVLLVSKSPVYMRRDRLVGKS